MNKVHIMIVENETIIAMEIENRLQKLGYKVPAAVSSGQEAIEKAAKIQPDLVLMDIRLQGNMDGIAAAQQIQTYYDIPVIYLTAYANEDTLQRAKVTEPFGYLLKPFEDRELHITIEMALYKHKMEQKLKVREAQFSGILDIAAEAIITVDEAQRIIIFNKEAERTFGYTAPEVIGQSLDLLLPERFQAIHRHYIAKFATTAAMTRKMGERHEIYGYRKNGENFPAEASISKLELDNKKIFTVILRDITRRKKLEAQLQQSQKMEAVGRLAGGIAHDFNNLLTVITGYSGLLLHNLTPDDPLRDDIEQIERAGDRAAKLIHQLLAFSRKQIIEPIALNLNDIVADIDKMLQRLIGENIEIASNLDPTLAQAKADPGQIEQIIVNLAVNARDAMPQGGKLTIKTANVEFDGVYTHPHLNIQVGNYVLLAISDTGVGLDAETQSRIFEPFFTTKEQGKGTGLGLATVYGIVKQNNGHIWLYSEPGQGSTFKVYLPQIEKTTAEIKATSRPTKLTQGSETILLVEDEEAVRTLASAILQENGYKVLEAGRGDEALFISEAYGNRIDLLLTDVVMPGGMSGRDLAERLGALYPQMKILYMSGYTDDAIIHHGVLHANVAFLEKPFTHNTLIRKVRQVLDTPVSSPLEPPTH